MFIPEESSQTDILRELGKRFKEYRMRLNLTQKDISDQTTISVPTIYKFESGRVTDMSFVTLLKLMKAIGQYVNWDKLMPELPESPYLYKETKKRQRIRHTKK